MASALTPHFASAVRSRSPDRLRTSVTQNGQAPARGRLATWLAWLTLASFTTLNAPIFLCQHLTSDAALYDLQARCVLQGGVLYRDIVEPNLPGVVWIHLLVRSLAGWSSVALRAWDLLLLVTLLACGVRLCWPDRATRPRCGPPLFCLTVVSLYLPFTEWCHCQRDLWMLLPCLVAGMLRLRSASPPQLRPSLRAAWLEGLAWGVAFWIKPHIAIPAACVWTLTCVTERRRPGLWRVFGCVLLGGASAGALGSAWLWSSGAWPWFWDMQLNWNPEYVRAGRQKLTGDALLWLWRGFAPWSWTLVPAIALALRELITTLCTHRVSANSPRLTAQSLIASLFLGWLAQALLLQHPFAYVYLPVIVLGLLMIAATCDVWTPLLPVRALATAWACFVLISLAEGQWRRTTHWRECLALTPTPALRARIQVEGQPDWAELAPVIEFLQQQSLQDGELTAYNGGVVQLYSQLDLAPSTRYVYLDVLLRLFPSRRDQIAAAVANSRQRFIVSSLKEAGMSPDHYAGADHPDTGLPAAFPAARLMEFPYTQPVVFRRGQYVVHAATASIGAMCVDSTPLAAPARSDQDAGRFEEPVDAQ